MYKNRNKLLKLILDTLFLWSLDKCSKTFPSPPKVTAAKKVRSRNKENPSLLAVPCLGSTGNLPNPVLFHFKGKAEVRISSFLMVH